MGANEIDKETLFRKIMPSAPLPVQGDEADGGAPVAATETESLAQPGSEPGKQAADEPPRQPQNQGENATNADKTPPPTGSEAETTAPAPSPLPPGEAPQLPLSALPELTPMEEAQAMQRAAAVIPQQPVLPASTDAGTAEEPPEEEQQNLEQALHNFAQAVEHPSEQHQPDEVAAVNIVELLVERYYPRYRQRLAGCECQRCQDDVCGMALNQIKPRYTTTDKLTGEELNDRKLITDTVTALIKALFVVKRNPHHDDFGSVRL